MKKLWTTKQLPENMPALPEYPHLVARLLALRGFTETDEIQKFLEPDYSDLLDPFLFKDMQKAIERICAAIDKQEAITIYSDYDADAITACSVMYLAIQKLGGKVDVYIPDRFAEGYGMNVEAIDKLKERGTNLIITVDCGINAVAEAARAKELGMELIITDHHELTGELPDCFAIINPKNPNDNYPAPYITGVGVAFKVVQALFTHNPERLAKKEIPEGWEKWLLDLVAIGTVADCQNLVGENRVMVSFGLKVLSKTRWPGLRALLEQAALKNNKYDSFTLGFIIAPRINAAGRIKHADLAFKLLVSENILEAQNYAVELNNLNTHRQKLTEQILSEARAQVELIGDRKVLLAAGENWPKGVVGLAAGKLSEESGKPVLIMEKGEVYATGSGRSSGDFDLVEALGFAKEFLHKYGGHTQAAGFTLLNQNVEPFYQKLLEYCETKNFENTSPVLEADMEIDAADINWENYEYLERFAPFGFGNNKPRFIVKELECMETKLMGANSQHFKARVKIGENIFDALAFNKAFWSKIVSAGCKFDAVIELECNEWNGSRSLQLKLIDIQT